MEKAPYCDWQSFLSCYGKAQLCMRQTVGQLRAKAMMRGIETSTSSRWVIRHSPRSFTSAATWGQSFLSQSGLLRSVGEADSIATGSITVNTTHVSSHHSPISFCVLEAQTSHDDPGSKGRRRISDLQRSPAPGKLDILAMCSLLHFGLGDWHRRWYVDTEEGSCLFGADRSPKGIDQANRHLRTGLSQCYADKVTNKPS